MTIAHHNKQKVKNLLEREQVPMGQIRCPPRFQKPCSTQFSKKLLNLVDKVTIVRINLPNFKIHLLKISIIFDFAYKTVLTIF